jgi:hypothetical protein
MAALDAWAIEDCVVSRVFVHNLTFEDATIFEREVEDVPVRRIRHRIELYNGRHAVQGLQPVTHATKIAVTTV